MKWNELSESKPAKGKLVVLAGRGMPEVVGRAGSGEWSLHVAPGAFLNMSLWEKWIALPEPELWGKSKRRVKKALVDTDSDTG